MVNLCLTCLDLPNKHISTYSIFLDRNVFKQFRIYHLSMDKETIDIWYKLPCFSKLFIITFIFLNICYLNAFLFASALDFLKNTKKSNGSLHFKINAFNTSNFITKWNSKYFGKYITIMKLEYFIIEINLFYNIDFFEIEKKIRIRFNRIFPYYHQFCSLFIESKGVVFSLLKILFCRKHYDSFKILSKLIWKLSKNEYFMKVEETILQRDFK